MNTATPMSEAPNLFDLLESVSGDQAMSTLFSTYSVCSDDNTDFGDGAPALSPCADDTAPSDARLKTDIVHVGKTCYGLPLYQFRYRTGEERFEGVMAQDVLEVMPDAVTVGENGYYHVSYARLGITMARV